MPVASCARRTIRLPTRHRLRPRLIPRRLPIPHLLILLQTQSLLIQHPLIRPRRLPIPTRSTIRRWAGRSRTRQPILTRLRRMSRLRM